MVVTMRFFGLGEGEVGFDCLDVCIGYEACLTQSALTLTALLLKNVSGTLFPAQHLP